MTGFAGNKKEWPPEVAARMRATLIWFLVVMLLSMVLTISYVAGRTLSADGKVPAPTSAAVAAPPVGAALPVDLPPPRSPEMPMPVPQTSVIEAVEPLPPVSPPREALARIEAQTTAANLTETGAEPTRRQPAAPPKVDPPEPGLYLQVAAVDYPSAERMVGIVRKTGLHAVIVPGPSETVFRVVMGPMPSREAFAAAKANLTAGGLVSFGRYFP
jgi:hypothetical protein